MTFRATILVVLALTAASSPAAGPRPRVLAGVPKLQNNRVFELARRGAEEMARELGVELLWKASREADAIEQRNIVNSLIEQRVVGLFISVSNATVLQEAIDDAVATGISVLCFNADAPGIRRLTCFSVDDQKAGASGIEILVERMGNSGLVGIPHGTAGTPNLKRRIQGFGERMQQLAQSVKLLAGR